MSFNDNYSEKLDEFRTQLVNSLQPQPYLDEFRSSGVMTIQDSEKILNRYRHSNTASQIGEMLDILKTKGPRGYSIFINVLGIRNPDIYTEMTGKEAPEQPISISCNCNCHERGNITNLEQLTEALRRKEQLEDEVRVYKDINEKLSTQGKDCADKLNRLWKRFKVEKEKNKDRDRLEEERNEMMEQLTGVTGKALSYKEELDVATNNLHQTRLELLRLKRELEKANRGLKQQRQRSMQIERSYSHSRTLIKNTEELQEKVTMLELELCKADKGENNRASYIPPSTDEASDATGAASASDKDSRLLQLQTHLEIMRNDRDEALRKAEDAVSQMYKVTKELHEKAEKSEKLAREKDDLLLNLETQKDEADMQKHFVLLAEDQLTRAVEERNQALEEKNLQTAKCARLMLQRDSLIEQQRTLRAEMTNLKEKQVAAETKMVKYKAKLRKKSGQHRGGDNEGQGDDGDYDSSSSADSNFTGKFDITLEATDAEQKDEESDQSANKRDSSTSGTSTNDPTMQLSEESEEDIGPAPEFRRRTQQVLSRYPDGQNKVSVFPAEAFQSGDPQSAGASTDEDGSPYMAGIFSSRPTSASTKVQADRDSLYRNQLRLGYGSIINHGGTKRVKRREKKPSPNMQFKRRSKSFNDLSSVSLEEELDLDLDFDLAFKEENARYSPIVGRYYKTRDIDRNMNLKQDFERSDGGLADIDSSGEIHIENIHIRRPRKLSHGLVFINKLVEVGKNVLHEPNFMKRYKEEVAFKDF